MFGRALPGQKPSSTNDPPPHKLRLETRDTNGRALTAAMRISMRKDMGTK
jgi:hypothetical protein